ncbi:MAG: DNA polymerase III subunit beta, partial [Micrococcales bacterium]
AKVETSGRILVSGRLLSEIASRLPNAPVEFNAEGTKLVVSCGSSKFTLPTMDVESYPTLPELPQVSGTISGEAFSEAVAQVVIAASKEDVIPGLTGVLVEASKSSISMVATDRFRVALREVAWNGTSIADGQTALVPARTLQEVAKTFANQAEVAISITGSEDRPMIAFKANNRSVTTQLVKGNFPAVKALFPTENPNFAIVSTSELVESTRRVSLVLDRTSALKYTFEGSEVVLEATGNETAQASESVNVELTGSAISVKLKPQFLIDGLSGVQGEFAKISFTNTDNPHKPGPVLITSQASKENSKADSYRYLLQPNLL